MDIQNIIKSDNCRIIDVRTPAEFSGGHVVGSRNIPLNEIPDYVNELRDMEDPVVLCCASGNRSGQATAFLQAQGLDNVFNGGSWLDVNFVKNN
jgi:phage shock protein E